MGIRMYDLKALLVHLPIFLNSGFDIPLALAMLQAPILREWEVLPMVEIFLLQLPLFSRQLRTGNW